MKTLLLLALTMTSFSSFAFTKSLSGKNELRAFLSHDRNQWIMDEIVVLKHTHYPTLKKISRLDISMTEVDEDGFGADCQISVTIFMNGNKNPLAEKIADTKSSCPKF